MPVALPCRKNLPVSGLKWPAAACIKKSSQNGTAGNNIAGYADSAVTTRQLQKSVIRTLIEIHAAVTRRLGLCDSVSSPWVKGANSSAEG